MGESSAVPIAASGTLRHGRFVLGININRLGDLVMRLSIAILVVLSVGIAVSVGWILISSAWLSITHNGLSFLTNRGFDPIHDSFGVAPAIFGTLVTSAIALILAAPIGIGIAIFLVEYSPRGLRAPLSFFIDLLATVPSIIIGLWGFKVMVPWLSKTGEPWLAAHFGFLPFFQGAQHGLGLLAGGLILTVMILPLVIAVGREVMLIVPNEQREALLALGATKWEVVRYAILPFAQIGIAGGVFLALGRALGETIAVTLVIGNQSSQVSPSLFDTGYTLSSIIVNQFGEATPGVFTSALMETALIIFFLTVITNLIARILVARMSHGRRIGGLFA